MPHDHSHDEHSHALLPSDPALRVKALETVLTRKGLIDPEAIDVLIDQFENRVGPQHGAKVVARAWSDPEFKARLLKDASDASREMGFDVGPMHLIAVENTDDTHNVIVCTLCSCYPRNLLGLPPDWYKSRAYRSRTVKEPRKVLAEFGVTLPESTKIRVHDSTADMRYVVIPARPSGTEQLSETELAALVTRDSMIGTGLARAPSA